MCAPGPAVVWLSWRYAATAPEIWLSGLKSRLIDALELLHRDRLPYLRIMTDESSLAL